MKKLMLAIGILLVVLSVAGATAAFNIHAQTNGVEETTQDFGAVWDQSVTVKPASFKPSLGAEAAIAMAREEVKKRDHWDVAALPARTTIAKFTGEPEGRPGSFVKDLSVRIVVIENVPIRAHFGETIKTRVSLALEDETGEFIYGAITMDTRDNCDTDPNNLVCH
jgi:hypothetical protein